MKTARSCFLLALAAGALLALPACESETREPGKGRSLAPVPVKTVAASVQPVPVILEGVGTLVGNESVTLTAKVTEQVSAVYFEGGEFVEAGDILVELIDEEQLALLREAEASLREAKLQFERLISLGIEIATAAETDVARARVDAGQAILEALRARIEDRDIRAPFDGVIGFRQISVGALLTPGTVIAELDDIDPLKLDFTLPESQFAKLSIGAPVVAQSAAWPELSFSGAVNQLGSRIDPVTRAFSVRALLDNPDGKLRPGMLMTVDVDVGSSEAIIIPETALLQSGAQSSVYLVDNESKARRVSVTIGRRLPGAIEIRSGISQGDRVISSGQITLRPGISVVEINSETLSEAD